MYVGLAAVAAVRGAADLLRGRLLKHIYIYNY